jgi:cytochrome c
MMNQIEETINTSVLGGRAISATVALLGLVVFATMLPFKAHGQSAQDGKALFERRCNGCHALDADHEGPRLKGVVGRMAGSVKTFQYSKSLQNAGFKWDEAKLDKWLTDTESVVPDNDMSFRVPKQEERAAIIAYLKSLSSQ